MDYGKFCYEQEKALKIAKRNQVVSELKEIKFRPKTDDNDYQTKLNHIKRFISNGDRCKIVLFFRGREIQFKTKNNPLFDKIKTDLSNIARVTQEPSDDGRSITMIVAP